MGMDGGGIDALRVVQNNRRVDEKTEHAGSDQIPECHAHKEIDGPFVGVGFSAFIDDVQVVDRFKSEQRQGHHLEGGEHGTQRDDHRGGAAPV